MLFHASVRSLIEVRQALQAIQRIFLTEIPRVWLKTAAPGVNDDETKGYRAGDRWIDQTNQDEYAAIKVPAGSAVWKKTTP